MKNKILKSYAAVLKKSAANISIISVGTFLVSGKLFNLFTNKCQDLHADVAAGESAKEKLKSMGLYTPLDDIFDMQYRSNMQSIIDCLGCYTDPQNYCIPEESIKYIQVLAEKQFDFDIRFDFDCNKLVPSESSVTIKHFSGDKLDFRKTLIFNVYKDKNNTDRVVWSVK